MSESDTKETVRKFVVQVLLNDRSDVTLREDENLLTGGLIDSIGIMQLVGFIEEKFAVDVPPEDVTIENFSTIATIESYLHDRKSGAAR